MTISGTQASAAALPTQNTTAAGAIAKPAITGDHGFATTPTPPSIAKGMPALPPAPYYNPFDAIRRAIEDLLRAIQQLNGPVGPQPPYDPYGPYGPYNPPYEPPYTPDSGCPHMHPPYGPIEPPIGPIGPFPPATTKKAPEVGDTLATITLDKSRPASKISVKSVHGTYNDRAKAVAAAKHLSGIFGDKPFGVAVSGLPGQEKYTVVGLNSSTPLKASQVGNISGRVTDGWALETIAFDAKTAKHVKLGLPSIEPPTTTKPGDLPLPPGGPIIGPTLPPVPPAPDVPLPVPTPASHTH